MIVKVPWTQTRSISAICCHLGLHSTDAYSARHLSLLSVGVSLPGDCRQPYRVLSLIFLGFDRCALPDMEEVLSSDCHFPVYKGQAVSGQVERDKQSGRRAFPPVFPGDNCFLILSSNPY